MQSRKSSEADHVANTQSCTSGCTTSTPCVDPYLGCLPICAAQSVVPGSCTGAGGAVCDCVNGSGCTKCVLAAKLTGGLANELVLNALPGGGGTFYYEDGRYLDCNATPSGSQVPPGIDYCATYSPSEFAPFYPGGASGPTALAGNAGFLSADAAVM